MIKFISVKCPECNASLSVEEGRNTAFCTYCGAKVLMNNENEHIYKYVDEAEIKKAEVELKRMELQENKRLHDEKVKKFKIILSLILGLIAVIMFFSSSIESTNSNGTSRLAAFVIAEILFLAIIMIWTVGNPNYSNNQKNKKKK